MTRGVAGVSTTYWHTVALPGAPVQYYFDVRPFTWQMDQIVAAGYQSPGGIIVTDWGCVANEPGGTPDWATFEIRKQRAGAMFEAELRNRISAGWRVIMLEFTEWFAETGDAGDPHNCGYYLRAAQETFFANMGSLVTRFPTRAVLGANWNNPAYYADNIHFGKLSSDLIVPELAAMVVAKRATAP